MRIAELTCACIDLGLEIAFRAAQGVHPLPPQSFVTQEKPADAAEQQYDGRDESGDGGSLWHGYSSVP